MEKIAATGFGDTELYANYVFLDTDERTRFAQNAIQVYLTAGQKIGFHPYNNSTNNEIIQTSTHTWFKGCLLG